MLFSPEAHEAVADESWSAGAARVTIAAIVADTESAFDDGWPAHPQDVIEGEDPSMRLLTLYEGATARSAHSGATALPGWSRRLPIFSTRRSRSPGAS